MSAPVVFISYSHDSEQHLSWVLKLATDLRSNGVDASLDKWDISPGQDLAAYMTEGITSSDCVLLVCTDNFVKKATDGSGGVGYERLIVTGELVRNIDTKKFVPLVRDNDSDPKLPPFLGSRLYIDFSKDDEYEGRLQELLRELLGAPAPAKPPLGANPFLGSAPSTTSGREVGPTGLTDNGTALLDGDWFEASRDHAVSAVSDLGFGGHMELRFGLHVPLNKSQVELLNAVRRSEIRTFGWPIGITLGNREEHRPRPSTDGIKAEISISEKGISGLPSYDYWTLSSNGDFYLLQTLFEDEKEENRIFFNTRIVRVTEALMFAGNLYSNLGTAPEAYLSVRVTHRGLKGRVLSSSTPNRDIMPGVSNEPEASSEIVTTLGTIRTTLVEDVTRLTAPMFMLFDFKDFGEPVYTDIVRRFEKGDVS